MKMLMFIVGVVCLTFGGGFTAQWLFTPANPDAPVVRVIPVQDVDALLWKHRVDSFPVVCDGETVYAYDTSGVACLYWTDWEDIKDDESFSVNKDVFWDSVFAADSIETLNSRINSFKGHVNLPCTLRYVSSAQDTIPPDPCAGIIEAVEDRDSLIKSYNDLLGKIRAKFPPDLDWINEFDNCREMRWLWFQDIKEARE